VPQYLAADGLRLAYRVQGSGPELLCLPGGPMVASAYLGDLGGLAATRRLILPDLRGTGESEVPADLATCRCDRLADDVEALRIHLDLDQMDVLAHSAGANIAVRYIERYPDRLRRLTLVTPSTRAVGLSETVESRRATMQRHKHEPWYPDAAAAFERINSGQAADDDWDIMEPLTHGRWDGAALALVAVIAEQVNADAAQAFGADGAFEPERTRTALATFAGEVLLLAGEADMVTGPKLAAEYAALFRHCELVVQPGAGHYPWLDDADEFGRLIASLPVSVGSSLRADRRGGGMR
jgi:proline iminopeptidase